MQIIWCTLILSTLLAGCAGQQKSGGFAVSHTLANYKTGITIVIQESRTDDGEKLPFGVLLMSSANPYSGATGGGVGKEPELPEWFEISWKETGPDLELTNKQYKALDESARDVRVRAYQSLPVKSARIAVRSRVPATVIEELMQSPLDPE
jgi:hypothetical protein